MSAKNDDTSGPSKTYLDANDEIAELDEQFFREAKASKDVPELAAFLRTHGKLGRPALEEEARKQRVTMYLDRDVIARLKEDGRGWQTRANEKLRVVLGL